LIESVIWVSSSETKRSHARRTTKREIAVCVCVWGLFCCGLRAHTGVVRRRIALGGFVDFGSSLNIHSLTLCRDQSSRGGGGRGSLRCVFICVLSVRVE
jgi:hypothetical protein